MIVDPARSAQLLQDDLADLFESWDVDHGTPLNEHPGLVQAVVDALIDHATRMAGYTPEDEYPVIITETSVYVAWIAGDNAKDVAKDANECGELYEYLTNNTAVSGSLEAEEPDKYERHWVYPDRIGPNNGCQICNHRQITERISDYVYHASDCEVGIAFRAEQDARWERERIERATARTSQDGSAATGEQAAVR